MSENSQTVPRTADTPSPGIIEVMNLWRGCVGVMSGLGGLIGIEPVFLFVFLSGGDGDVVGCGILSFELPSF